MSNPVIFQKFPFVQDVKPGAYHWCACGQSKSQPFCDSSHKATEFTPVKFSNAVAQKVWLCGCKRSAGRPFCDGSHKKLTS